MVHAPNMLNTREPSKLPDVPILSLRRTVAPCGDKSLSIGGWTLTGWCPYCVSGLWRLLLSGFIKIRRAYLPQLHHHAYYLGVVHRHWSLYAL